MKPNGKITFKQAILLMKESCPRWDLHKKSHIDNIKNKFKKYKLIKIWNAVDLDMQCFMCIEAGINDTLFPQLPVKVKDIVPATWREIEMKWSEYKKTANYYHDYVKS